MQSASLQAAVKAACKALSAVGVSGVTPEAFRLAKLNSDDIRVKHIFWRALHDLVLLALCNFSFPNPKEKLAQLYNELLDEVTDQHVIHVVQYHLRLWKYPITEFFYSSFEDCTSRDLLLALGWLMARERIFQRYCDIAYFQAAPPELPTFPYDTTELAPSYTNKNQEVVEGDSTVQKMFSFSGDDPVFVRMNQLRHSLTKLDFGLRSLLSINTKYISTVHKLQLLQQYKLPNILTPYELYLIRTWHRAQSSKQPHLFHTHTQSLRAFNQAFDSKIKLAEHEKIFWKWMAGVIDEKETDEVLYRNDDPKPTNTKNKLKSSDFVDAFEKTHQQLAALIASEEQQIIFAALSAKWRQMREIMPPAAYSQLKQKLQPIATQISQQFPAIPQSEEYSSEVMQLLNDFAENEVDSTQRHTYIPKGSGERDVNNNNNNNNEESRGNDRNTTAVIYIKKEKPGKPSLHVQAPATPSAEMEKQRLYHMVNTVQQHLSLVQQKNTSQLSQVVDPFLEQRNLQMVLLAHK